MLTSLNNSFLSSFDFGWLCFALVVSIVCWYSGRFYHTCWRAPPGPSGVPGAGLLPMMLLASKQQQQQPPEQRWLALATAYDKQRCGMISFCVGVQRFVVLYSFDAMKDLLVDRTDIVVQRPKQALFQRLSQGRGLILSNGAVWKQHRRFSLTVLRNLGCGKSSMEVKIVDESRHLLQALRKHCGSQDRQEGMETHEIITKAVTNIVSGLIFGQRWAYDDAQLVQHLDNLRILNRIGSSVTQWEVFYPALSKLGVLKFFGYQQGAQLYRSRDSLCEMICDKLNEVELLSSQELTDSDAYQHYMEAFVGKSKLTASSASSTSASFCREQCIQASLDLYTAGTDTTATTLCWAILYLALHPAVQDRVFEEISALLQERNLCEVDQYELRNSLPYTQAVLDEVHRCASVVPRGISKQVQTTCQFRGCQINADDIIITSYYLMHHDPLHWPSPEEFRPERFLNADQTKYQPSKQLLSFGFGSRSCLGEILAKMEIFLLLTNLMKEWEFQLSPDCALTREEMLRGNMGIVHTPGVHKICFVLRCKKK